MVVLFEKLFITVALGRLCVITCIVKNPWQIIGREMRLLEDHHNDTHILKDIRGRRVTDL